MSLVGLRATLFRLRPNPPIRARPFSFQARPPTSKLLTYRTQSFRALDGLHSPFKQKRFNSSRPNPDPTPSLNAPQAQSLGQRLKALGKEYGWTAMGVYLALSVIDFPFCFLAVKMVGPERVGQWEHAVIDAVRSVVQMLFPNVMMKKEDAILEDEARDVTALEGESSARDSASIWTLLGLAYAVHKSLIFIRVPITAGILPSVVKTLRRWGYNVGKRQPKQTRL